MLRATVLIDALHAALEHREEAFRRVGVSVAAHVDLVGMIDRQPGSIGGFVSYGCIGMYNADITDLFARVGYGTTVVVTQ